MGTVLLIRTPESGHSGMIRYVLGRCGHLGLVQSA